MTLDRDSAEEAAKCQTMKGKPSTEACIENFSGILDDEEEANRTEARRQKEMREAQNRRLQLKDVFFQLCVKHVESNLSKFD